MYDVAVFESAMQSAARARAAWNRRIDTDGVNGDALDSVWKQIMRSYKACVRAKARVTNEIGMLDIAGTFFLIKSAITVVSDVQAKCRATMTDLMRNVNFEKMVFFYNIV